MTTVPLAHDLAGTGPLLVLLHGITENRHSWDPVHLEDSFTVLRVDLRGHGESPRTAPYDLATLAADVRGVVDAIGAEEAPLVVGHSMGGVVATAYAHAHPVRGVINVDQALALGAMQAQVAPAAPMLRGDGFDGFIQQMFASMYGELDPAEVARLEALRSPERDVVLGMWSPLLDMSPDELAATVAEVTALPAGTPYLSLHGIDLGPDYAAWLTSVIPSAVVETWTPAGHYPHLAAPERFVARVVAFDAR
jgi:pimeloyl-ACP methyl ester carboxylesterase